MQNAKLTNFGGVVTGYIPCILSQLAQKNTDQLLVHITERSSDLDNIAKNIAFFCPHAEVLTFPGWDCLPYDRSSPHKNVMSKRLDTLRKLLTVSSGPRILVISVSALMQYVISPQHLLPNISYILGQQLSFDTITKQLMVRGYLRVNSVRDQGEFAVRGGIIDIYPAQALNPVRIELFGDEIESIKRFDPLSQRSIDKIDSLAIAATGEVILSQQNIEYFQHQYKTLFGSSAQNDPMYQSISQSRPVGGMEHLLPLFYPKLSSIFDYLSPDSVMTCCDNMPELLKRRQVQIQDYYQARKTTAALEDSPMRTVPMQELYILPQDAHNSFNNFQSIVFTAFVTPNLVDQKSRLTPALLNKTNDRTALCQTLKKIIATAQKQRKHVMISAHTKGACDRIKSFLQDYGFNNLKLVENLSQIKDLSTIYTSVAPVLHGFESEELLVFTEEDLLGKRSNSTSASNKRADLFIAEATALNQGDLLVHQDHGVGRFISLVTIAADRAPHECVCLEYAGGDKLFVPVENMEILSKFGSQTGDEFPLDKLGSAAWQNRKAKAKNRIQGLAQGLIKLAAARAAKHCEVIPINTGLYNEFCAKFPYTETQDQERAINDVMHDLSSGHPMDRLICGDVGFGKTEVALRAAFLVASAGKQVAIIAPTTLLSRQHYLSFKQRFDGFGICVEQLSRLVTESEKNRIRNDLKSGKCQIVVGTHAILSSVVEFQDLGLVIVDEEQRFGVVQKEKLKQLSASLHLLTLTATPIPRTLQMALCGVRDISLIATPPIDRLSVHTYVMPYDPVIVREALLREYGRGGQSFFICPRVQELAKIEQKLKKLVPDLKIISAHGQLPPRELEEVMIAFDRKEYDVLIATNIIESGIDIPNANTMIVYRSDMFGLAQLYQIRGRIGRSKQRGYAYLTMLDPNALTKDSQRRLEVMQTLDSLGAGFQLASHDMDIRGAGNIIGDEQSGHIREVGVELYQQMLEDAIHAHQTDEPIAKHWTPQLNLGLAVMIPESYVSDLTLRMQLYRRLSHFSTKDELEEFAAELIDRFGTIPEEGKNLLDIVWLKQLSKSAGVARIDASHKAAVVQLHDNKFKNPLGLVGYVQKNASWIKIRPDQKIVFTLSSQDSTGYLNSIRKILEDLISL